MKVLFFALSFLVLAGKSFSAQVTLKIHLYSPWKDSATRNAPPAFIEVSGSGGPLPFRGMQMTSEGGDWYVASTPVTANDATDGYMTFVFANYVPSASDPYANRDVYQNGPNQFRLDSVFFANKFTEVWIYPQGPGKPPIIRDFAPPKKVVAFFNPWALGAPAIKVGAATTYKKMRLPPEGDTRCGWYVYYFSDDYSAAAASLPVSFNNIIGGETYGAGGLKDTKTIDLQATFAGNDTAFIVPDPLPGGPAKILTAFPDGTLGTCKFPLAVTIRDFSVENPDFNHAGSFPDKVTKGMVLPMLDAQNKPQKSATPYLQADFSNWFRDDSTNADPKLRNYTTCRDLPMSKKDDGYWGYSSYTDDTTKGYFPIQDFNRFNETFPIYYNVNYDKAQLVATTTPGNFSFCMEMDANFTYQKGQQFSFIGDDDVWVFINKKLAIDLGGTHSPAKDSVNLDTLGLVAGSQNDFRLFYCERQKNGSNLYIQTSIYFEQKQSVFAQQLAGQTSWDIYERHSGDKSCSASEGSDTTAVLAASDFKLSGPSVTPAALLSAGANYGGIVINPALTRVAVDTSKVTGLKPGLYTITYTSQASKKGGFVQFTIVAPPKSTVETPVASPSGKDFAANPTAGSVSLASATPGAAIFYTLDGTTPDTLARGSTKAYAAGTPIPISGITNIKAVATKADWIPSAVLSESYKPPVSVTKAFYQDKDGDGRIETVVIDFDKDLAAVPDKLSFQLKPAAGADEVRAASAAKGEITQPAGSKTEVIVTLSDPFPYGMTSADPAASGHLFAQDDIPLGDGAFTVADSVPPVIVATDVQQADSLDPFVRVVLTFSEPASVPTDSKTAIVFKHDADELTPAQVLIRGIVKLAENQYEFTIDSTSAKFPIVGDSVAINSDGQVKDANGNAPARKLFRKLDGTVPKPKPIVAFVTFPNGTNQPGHSVGAQPNTPSGISIIPFDSKANPLQGAAENGKCGTCYVGQEKNFIGPVINLEIPGPIEYEFKIFSNLGEFVTEGKGKIEEADLPSLAPIRNGTAYLARFVWNGRSVKDEKAGTGAYVLTVSVLIPRNLKNGAMASTDNKKMVFGMLRN